MLESLEDMIGWHLERRGSKMHSTRCRLEFEPTERGELKVRYWTKWLKLRSRRELPGRLKWLFSVFDQPSFRTAFEIQPRIQFYIDEKLPSNGNNVAKREQNGKFSWASSSKTNKRPKWKNLYEITYLYQSIPMATQMANPHTLSVHDREGKQD